MRIAFTTLGCRLNQFETDAMVRAAQEAGHQAVGFREPADVVVINSCTITHEADADTRQRVRQARRHNPDARVAVTGCYANAAPAEVAALPGVSLVFGNREKDQLPRWLATTSKASTPVLIPPVDLTRRVRLAALRPATDPGRSRAYLKIQDGCNYRCSFCIVPRVRGRSASLSPTTVLEQLGELLAAGVPEVVLTGVHLGTYGWDLSPRMSLYELLTQMIARIDASHVDCRLRLGSLDPHEVDDALIELFARRPDALSRYFHLPLQSGDDGVLKRMRRAHSVADLETLVPRLNEKVPGVAIGTDIIAGFPGESDAAFERTYALLSRLSLAYLHVFPYSRRAQTEAATMPEQVSASVRKDRCTRLRKLSQGKASTFRRAQVGKSHPAVVYRSRDRQTGCLVALTDNYIKVHIQGSDELLGRSVRVCIDDGGDQVATGHRLVRDA